MLNVLLQHFVSFTRPPNKEKLKFILQWTYILIRWEEDAFSKGAYSYHSVAVKDEDVEEISKPLFGGRLTFAGEYTDPVFYGSLNAAHNSGVRVAKEILQS